MKKKISCQNRFGGSTFSAFSKGQTSTSKFWKTPETRKMRHETFKCSKLCYFSKKIRQIKQKCLISRTPYFNNYSSVIRPPIPPRKEGKRKYKEGTIWKLFFLKHSFLIYQILIELRTFSILQSNSNKMNEIEIHAFIHILLYNI